MRVAARAAQWLQPRRALAVLAAAALLVATLVFSLAAQMLEEDLKPWIWRAPEQICASPALPEGELELVVGAGLCHGEDDWMRVHSWASVLGLPGLVIHVYWRDLGCKAWQGRTSLPCSMRYEHHVLLPNRGNEAAAFATYISTRYDSLPRAVAFVHHHGPHKSWHMRCDTFYERLWAYYRGLAERDDPRSRYAELVRGPLVSLSSGCLRNDVNLQIATRSDAVMRASLEQLCAIDEAPAAMNWSEALLDGGDELLGIAATLPPTPSARKLGKKNDGLKESTERVCRQAIAAEEHCAESTCDRPRGKLWSCCNTFIVRREAIRWQSKKLFDRFLSDCAFPATQLSSVSGRVMEHRAYAWFNGIFQSEAQHWKTTAARSVDATFVTSCGPSDSSALR